MTDRHAVIWTRGPEGPLKMGNLVATPTECRFSYTEDFLGRPGLPGLSLIAPPGLYDREAVVYPSSARMPLHPRLMALLPGDTPGNLQRRVLTALLARQPTPPRPGFETEWALLLLAGHGGIGHLDVFADDLQARDWYERQPAGGEAIGRRSAVWRFVREEVRQTAHSVDPDVISDLLGPTPSVGGMIPKLLAAIPDTADWDGRFAAPGTERIGPQACVEVVLKVEPPQYEGVLALEGLCLDIHRELGFEVPRHWLAEVDGLRLLAVERFDRDTHGRPLPMESFLSVMAAGNHRVFGTGDTELSAVGRMLERLATLVDLDRRVAQREVYRRFVLAFCTGNGDLHLENLAFLGGPEAVRVAPVYDPAPMRAWPRHNLRSAIPIAFEPGIGLGDNLVALGHAFGLSQREAAEILVDILERTADYGERLMALETVPAGRRENLARLIAEERRLLGSSLRRPG
ncbi:HipA domain-containing protein [Thiohalobacter sp. IOR34]|uniref:type II toxin-antitoxin system HipA family toxin n=1 Tax=Thiohalobacter sp. IOR34 TaxID=3057176 RepID=UPI0025B18F39|nr:HipA domain-containing protein [Thiohalobacter sp. IOR34]WJW76601.1 HipA domain-containing protein [Thiohalobacter sp. IOR34]